MDAEQLLNKAKMGLIHPEHKKKGNPVFYSTALFSLKFVWEEKIPTAGVDGTHLFINPHFLVTLSVLQAIGVLAHEALHIILRHLEVFKMHNMKVFSEDIERHLHNMAADHVINLLLLHAGYTLPDWVLADRRFTGLSTLAVYKILHKEYKENPFNLPDSSKDIIYLPTDDTTKSQEEYEKISRKISKTIQKAAVQSEMAGENPGNLPGDIKRILDSLRNPKLPFEIILANHFTRYARDEYSYRRPNRRYMPDMYLPSRYSPALCNIACAFDVSGSVSEKELSSFGGGLKMIQEQLKPEKISLIEFDTRIHGKVKEVTQDVEIKDITFHGGGGTDVTPVLEWAIKEKPEVLMIFTDGDFYYPQIEVNCDLIWIIHRNPNFRAKQGIVFHYDLED